MTASSATTRTRLAAALVTTLAALAVAAPAQAELVGGVRNGGCISGVQVGTANNDDGSFTPVCRIVR